LLSKDGKALVLSADTEKACAEIAEFSKKDADAYREYRAFIGKISGFVQSLLNEQPPDLSALGPKQLWPLAKKALALKRLGKETMMEFLKVAPMSVADFLNERFETQFLKAGICAPALHGSLTGPWSSYTTLNLLMWECTANDNVAGGPQALVSALEKAAREAGVEIRVSTEVDKITLDGNRKVSGVRLKSGEEIAARSVASSATPKITFYDLLLPNQISYELEHSVRNYRARGTTAKVNLAISKPLKFNGQEGVEYARTGNSFDEMEKAFDHVKYRRFSEEPVLDIHVPSLQDAALAPSGHAVLSIVVHFAPYQLDEGWSDATKAKLLKNVMNTLAKYAPEIESTVVGSEVLSPLDLETRYSLTSGHIYHGEPAIDQMITRPFPLCARYKTPVNGLYLCGSGTHPGGGVTGMPGYLGAKMILSDIG
jgi:phytoene dehydrogenase-like protein